MQNIINTDNANHMYMSSAHKMREESSLKPSQTEKSSSFNNNDKLQIKEQEEKKKEEIEEAQKTKKSSNETQDNYHDLIKRVAKNEEKKAHLSVYTQGQQDLLKQVEKNISPVDKRSFDFKV